MKRNIIRFRLLLLIASIILVLNYKLGAQNAVKLNQEFPDFCLKSHTGEVITLSDYKGKNVLLIFPRGKYLDGWCRACHYQYADLAKLQIEDNIETKYNLKILFILPYSWEEVRLWTTLFPMQMSIIESYKNPTREQLANPRIAAFSKEVNEVMPHSFHFDEQYPAPLPFPVLADEDHNLSLSIGLFSTYWDNAYLEQNEPTIFILNSDGIVKFKYKSQVTLDRPSAKYLLIYIENNIR